MSKMFYMVRIAKEEQFMQLFLWKFSDDDKMRQLKIQFYHFSVGGCWQASSSENL